MEMLREYVIDDHIKRPAGDDIIEAAEQSELFEILPGFKLFLGSQDAAANVQVFWWCCLNERVLKKKGLLTF